MKENLIYNAIALNYASKKGGELLSDFEAVLKNSGDLTVAQLLDLTGNEMVARNSSMGTTEVAFGKEFVEEKILSAELIDRLRNSESVITRAVIRKMNGKKQAFPTRGVRIRMRAGSETVTDPTGVAPSGQIKRAGTAEIELEAKKLILTVYWSDELMEDSLIEISNFVMTELTDAFERSLHEIILNGDVDTGANTNINRIDGNTSGLPDGNSTDLLLFDGARKIAIDNSKTVNATGALALSHIRTARAAMGLKGMNPKDIAIVPDQGTYFALMNLSQVETIEKFGDAATVKDGVLVALDGCPIVNREEMVKAQADGTVSATAGNNTKGQIALIHMPSLNVGLRRGLTTEQSRHAEEQITGMTASARVAVKFDNTQNTTQATSPVALIVNI